MRHLNLFLIFIVLTIVYTGEINAQGRCPRNEVWNDCGSRCPPDCVRPGPRACTRDCNPGCFCRAGWLRNSWGICVRRCD